MVARLPPRRHLYGVGMDTRVDRLERRVRNLGLVMEQITRAVHEGRLRVRSVRTLRLGASQRPTG